MQARARRKRHTLVVATLAAASLLAMPPVTHASASFPEFLRVGARLTWSAGDATLEGSKLVPDANGWLWRDNQWYSVESTGGRGGIGYEQLDIQSVSDDVVVADVRYFLTSDIERNITVSSTAGVVTGDADALGAYWIAPDRLAALQEGYDGVTRIFRGQRRINGQSFDVVASATFREGSYLGYTYDLATGLLLVNGSLVAGPGVLVTDEAGNLLDSASGAVSLSHKQLVGTRQVDVPWADTPLPEWAVPGLVTTYQGENRVEFDPSAGVPNVSGQAVTMTHTFTRAVGMTLIGQQSSEFATAAGLPPSESVLDRVYGSAQFDGIWIPPESFGTFEPQQVLDQDSFTGQTVTFGGTQGQAAVIVIAGPADQLEQFYDVGSGVLTYSRYRRQIPGIGVNIIELTLIGQT